jgi:ribokinase
MGPGRVVVLGNAAVDLIQTVERLPRPGETLIATSLLRCPGGKGLNQALAAARAGACVRFSARIGDDQEGRFLRASLADEPGLDAVWLEAPVPTDLSVIWVAAGGENVIVSSIGCSQWPSRDGVGETLVPLGPTDILLMQGNLGGGASEAALDLAREAGATSILNVAPALPHAEQLAAAADIVVVNAGEAEDLERGASRVPDKLLRGRTRIAVVTRGPGTVLIAGERSVMRVPVPKVAAIDTAGAGDVFTGTFAAGLACRMPIEAAARRATAAAALSVQRKGTTSSFPSREEMAAIALG